MKHDLSTAAVYMDGGRGTYGRRPWNGRQRAVPSPTDNGTLSHKRTAFSPQENGFLSQKGRHSLHKRAARSPQEGHTVSTRKNTGTVSGKEVVQVYVTAPVGHASQRDNAIATVGHASLRDTHIEKPAQELKAFAKTRELQPGESQTLTMQIPIRLLASFDEQGCQWLTEAGNYTFSIGSSCRDIKAAATAKVGQYTEKVSNTLAPRKS